MKKFLVTILAFVYISSSTGAIVQMQYCLGSLAAAGCCNQKTNTCDQFGREKSRQKNVDCCKGVCKYLKIQSQVANSSGFHLIRPVSPALPVFFFDMTSVDISVLPAENPTSHAPPKDSGVAAYIRNCVFLI